MREALQFIGQKNELAGAPVKTSDATVCGYTVHMCSYTVLDNVKDAVENMPMAFIVGGILAVIIKNDDGEI